MNASRVAREIADQIEWIRSSPGYSADRQDLLDTLQRWLVWLAPPRPKRKRDPLRAERRATVRELDKMCREIVFARDEAKCRACGRTEGLLDWAHILSRRHPKVRHDPVNSVVLCRACHMKFHDRPVEGARILDFILKPGEYAILKQRASGPGRMNHGLTRLHLIQEGKKYGLKLGGLP